MMESDKLYVPFASCDPGLVNQAFVKGVYSVDLRDRVIDVDIDTTYNGPVKSGDVKGHFSKEMVYSSQEAYMKRTKMMDCIDELIVEDNFFNPKTHVPPQYIVMHELGLHVQTITVMGKERGITTKVVSPSVVKQYYGLNTGSHYHNKKKALELIDALFEDTESHTVSKNLSNHESDCIINLCYYLNSKYPGYLINLAIKLQ